MDIGYAAGTVALKPSYALVYVPALLPEVKVHPVGDGHLVLTVLHTDARGVRLVAVAEVHTVEGAAEEDGDAPLRGIVHTAVHPPLFVFILHAAGDVGAVVGEVGTEHHRRRYGI